MQDRQSEFWPRQFLKKWLTFRHTGDDFDQDNDSAREEFSDSDELEDNDVVSIEGIEDTNAREMTKALPDDVAIPIADSPRKNPLLRLQSETLRDQFVVNNEYKIAVGTWNVAGLLPPDDLDLEGFLDLSDPADIYVLGFQEIVPLSTNNVLCVEDDAPTTIWDGLIRHALNNKMRCCEAPVKSYSAPPSAWHVEDLVGNAPEVSDIEGLLKTVVNEEALESSSLLKDCSNSCDSHWLHGANGRNMDETVRCLTKNVKTSEDWLLEAGMQDDDVTEESTLVATPCPVSQHSCKRYSRVASKQMVGVFLTIWVRSDIRQHIHNVKVCVIGCGILNFLGNKGAVSVSMSLHQTSFCFVCTHLTSGHKEGDELRRNTDVAEILRRTSFPRLVKLAGVQLPETIMAHDRVIWLGDLNYRIDLPDKETWILVNQCDWKSLLPRDQLQIEREAGRVFEGWHEDAISFPPTYKYVVESDQYFGEDTFAGDKRRTPAWCDRILWIGKGLRQMNYVMVESQLSDHRPVTAKLIAEVEAVSGQKLRRACRLTKSAKVNVEELLPRPFHMSEFRKNQNYEWTASDDQVPQKNILALWFEAFHWLNPTRPFRCILNNLPTTVVKASSPPQALCIAC